MSDSSVYVGDKLLNWIKGTAMGTAPTTVYASLWNGDPDAAGTEVTQSISLTRQPITFGSVTARAMSNSGALAFDNSSGSGSVTYVALYDSATAGNQICKKAISTVSITNGLAVQIASGNLTLSY